MAQNHVTFMIGCHDGHVVRKITIAPFGQAMVTVTEEHSAHALSPGVLAAIQANMQTFGTKNQLQRGRIFMYDGRHGVNHRDQESSKQVGILMDTLNNKLQFDHFI